MLERSNPCHHHSTNDHIEWETLPQAPRVKKGQCFGCSQLIKMVDSRNHQWFPKECCWYLPWPSWSCRLVKLHYQSSNWRLRSKTSFPESPAEEHRRLLPVQIVSFSWIQIGQYHRSIARQSFQDRWLICFGGVVSWDGCASDFLSRYLFFRVILPQWPTICWKCDSILSS